MVSNYKELCSLLNEPVLPSGSNSQKSQYKRFARFFKWEKFKRKFIITDIYDLPLSKIDGRLNGNNSIYVQYIEAILLRYLLCKTGYTCYITKNQLWKLLGMINNNYQNISLDQLKNDLEPFNINVTSYELNMFYHRSNQKLTPILFTALNNLENRSLIKFYKQTVIVMKDENSKRDIFTIASDKEYKQILTAERAILNDMGLYSKTQVYCKFKEKEFYNRFNDYLFTEYGWSYTYNQFKIIYNRPDIQFAISESEIRLKKTLLNEKIVRSLDVNAEKVFENRRIKANREYSERINQLDLTNNEVFIPNKNDLKIFEYPFYFVELQKLLSKKLISLNDNSEDIEEIGLKEIDLVFSSK